VYGDAAVVTALATRSGTLRGATYKDRQVLYTDTFVRREGRWQCVASQSTVVASAEIEQSRRRTNAAAHCFTRQFCAGAA
jgi:ketosteroid isomerase-like protein